MSDNNESPLRPKLTRSAWIGKRPRWSERRDLERVPLSLFLDEYVGERKHRALTTNVSATGLYMHRVRAGSYRDSRHVQLELKLPGTSDTIWARGEVRYDQLGDEMVHGTGVALTAIARGHQRLLRDYLYEQRRQKLERILELVRANRYH
jgi:hypothetical protein